MSIPIHPERGIDPHLTYCPRCGGEAEELTVGVLVKATFTKGGSETVVYANQGRGSRSEKDMNKQGWYKIDGWTQVTDTHERVPASQPCKKCLDLEAQAIEIVKAGGIHIKCEQCGMTGAIKDSPLARDVRAAHSIEAPNPCGLLFTTCKEHEDLGIGCSDKEEG